MRVREVRVGGVSECLSKRGVSVRGVNKKCEWVSK